jgi:hypothetical protein
MNFRVALSTLAIALSTIGIGVNSTWAGSDQPYGLKFTPISSEVTVQPPLADHRHRARPDAVACYGEWCQVGVGECCAGFVCRTVRRGSDIGRCLHH